MKIYYDNVRIRERWSDELSNQSYYGLNVSEEIKRLPEQKMIRKGEA